ncbi:MAG: YHYH protein [Bacteroidetes bacterium]|nr:YHYH protein [Bacteroidota bacterium]
MMTALVVCSSFALHAQTDPEITSWLINTSSITGRHYVSGNSTPINDTAKANVQLVRYSDDYVYVNSSGIPAYIVGPYLDGNPALATNNDWLWKIPRAPKENTGTGTTTPLGPIAVFVNGVPMYDYKDAASYNSSTKQDDMQGGDGVWNRNAIMAENDGFDCAKGHPSPKFSGGPPPMGTLEGGSYHHHQNPTAFNLDKTEISDICDLYLADGLYKLDDTKHSPLVGYAFDGYPIYGAYGYANTDGTGGIKRMESSYQKRNITKRDKLADGTDVTDGPDVGADFPLGWYREDYEFKDGSGDLDEHNGRFCVTPEYPDGTYAYFCTVDENWNSAYPYAIGSTYYGVVEQSNFTGMGGATTVKVTETTKKFNGTIAISQVDENFEISVFPNPASDLIIIQAEGMPKSDFTVQLFNMEGKVVSSTKLNQGSTIAYIDARTLYNGHYVVKLSNGETVQEKSIQILK